MKFKMYILKGLIEVSGENQAANVFREHFSNSAKSRQRFEP